MTPDEYGHVLDMILPGAESSAEDAGYALQEGTLQLLIRIVEAAGIRSVFEFGSGRSTKAFLAAGCSVTSLEDSESWLQETLATLTAEERSRLHPVCKPLEIIFHEGAPFRSWNPDAETLGRLAAADLVLIDAPAFPPFREHPLSLSLAHCRNALIVVDDARIPTIHRFCARMAGGIVHRECPIDHGLYFLAGTADVKIRRRNPIETIKAWRRFFMSR